LSLSKGCLRFDKLSIYALWVRTVKTSKGRINSVMQAQAKWTLAGLLEDGEKKKKKQVLGYPVLGNENQMMDLYELGINKAMVAIGNNAGRKRIANLLQIQGFELIRIVHPTACLMTDCVIGAGAFVHAFTMIGAECHLGSNVIVQPYTSLGHESRIGDSVQFCPGVHIGGQVTIGDCCFFGPGAVVYPGVKIGDHVSVGANSVVNKDVPNQVVIVGNPARQSVHKS